MSEAAGQAPAGAEQLATSGRRWDEPGAVAPRIALFLFGCPDSAAVERILARIPPDALARLEEVVVMQEPSAKVAPPADELPGLPHPANLRFQRLPRDAGYGGARKAAFEYALLKGFDHVLTMRGDGLHPPEALPQLLAPILSDPRRMVFARREMRLGSGSGWWRRVPDALAHVVATGLQNRLLGLRLHDYHSGYRLYSMRAVERLPFQLNSDEHHFDMEMVIQCRVLGIPVEEVAVAPVWQEYPTRRVGLAEVLRACRCAVDYRLHQLHVYRLGQYFVDEGVRYTLKRSRTGSHMQIVEAIERGSRVLDLGCSQGLLARPLREKQVRVTGVDIAPEAHRVPELEEYFVRDLEQPLELPLGREFDYVVVSDVIEHLRNRTQLLREARRFLKEGGRLIISTPNIALWFYRLSLAVGRFEYGPRGVLDETHVHLFTRATFRREVERAGFHVVAERVTALPFEVVFESTGRSRLIRSVSHAYHALARLWPAMFAYQHIIEAEITTLDEEWTAA